MPDGHITVMVNEYVRGLLDECPYVDDVLYGFRHGEQGRAGRLRALLRVVAAISGRYDIVIGLRWSPALTPVLGLLSGARVRVGYQSTHRLSRLLTHGLGPEVLGPVPNRTLNRAPLSALGVPTDEHYDPIDWLPPSTEETLDATLKVVGVEADKPLAVVHLSSHWGCNEWSSDKWSRLIDHLQRRHGMQVLATGRGEPHERQKFAEVAGGCRRPPLSAIGRTSLLELVALARRADLLVSCDTAMTQVALVQRTPSVIMFGIEEIEANGPATQEERSVMRTLQHWEGPGLAPPPNPMCRFDQGQCHWAHCAEDSSRRQITVLDVIAQIDRLAREGRLRLETGAFAGRALPE